MKLKIVLLKNNKKILKLALLLLFAPAFLAFILTVNAAAEQDINAMNDVGLLYYNSGNYEEAISEFQKILKIKPDHDTAHFNLGCVYQKKKNWKEADRYFTNVLDIVPNDNEAKKRLILSAEAWVKQLKTDLAGQPQNPNLHNDLGRAYISLDKLDDAYAEISKALAIKADLAAAHYNLAYLYLKKDSPQKAVDEIKKACEIEPKNVIYQKYYKKVASIAGTSAPEVSEQPQQTPAEQAEDGIFSGSKKDEENIFKAGVDAFEKKKYEQALSNFEKVRKMNSKNEEASKYIAKINDILKSKKQIRDLFESADKLCKKNKWNEAITYLEKAKNNPNIKQDPNYLDVLKTLSDAYMRINEYDKAFAIYEELKTQNSNLFFVNYNMAQIYLYRGQYDLAEEALNKAANADGASVEQIKRAREIQSDLKWQKNKIFVYGVGFMFAAAFAGALGVFYSPMARKKRLIQKIEELRNSSDWNSIFKISSSLPNFNYTIQENVKINITTAMACYNMEKYDDGIRYAKKALNYDAGLTAANELLAKCYLKKKIVSDEAIFQYKKLLKNDPNNTEVLKLISEYYIKLSKNTDKFVKKESLTDEIIDALKIYASREPQNRELAIFTANLLRQRKDTSQMAVSIYENSLSYEENVKVRDVLAKAYYEAKNYDKAIAECNLIFKENVENTQTHRVFIDSHMALGRYNDLCIEYEKLALLYPNSADIERRLNELKKQTMVIGGTSGDKQGSDGENQSQTAEGQSAAPALKQQSVAASSTDYEKCFERGCKFIESKDYNNAISEFKLASKGSVPMRNESNKKLVLCYIKKGLLDMAYEQYKLVKYDQEIMPDEVKELTYDMGRAFEEKGKFKEALEIYNLICKVDIGYKDVFDKFEELHSYVSKFN
ncbi:MAG: tetratricopeptide repeat protein [Candidatus Wallbacteria bacterium]|mgnify:CR=1 FL=1